MQIFVKTLANKTHCLDVEPTDKLEDIKNKIIEKEEKSKVNYTLVFRDAILDFEKTLSDYNIKNE